MYRRRWTEKHHLIVEQDVTNGGLDNHQLFSMAQKTKQMLGQEQLQVVAEYLPTTTTKS